MSEIEKFKERIAQANEAETRAKLEKQAQEAEFAARKAKWEAKYAKAGSFRRSLMEVDQLVFKDYR